MPNNYILLDRIELNNTAASVTFDNIPQSGYTDLKIVMSTRSSSTNVTGFVTAAFNGSTANFSIRGLYGTGSGVGSFTTPSNFVGELVGNGSTASTFSNLEMYIPNYRSSNFKSYSVDSVAENNATQAQSGLTAGLWSSTAAITSVTFTTNSGNFLAGSTFSLYGIAQVGTTPAIAPKADGGNVIGTDGTYWYHAFLSNGTFTPQTNITADVLVVAGGGGGGGIGGGGGAGGLLAYTAQPLTATNYSVLIGGPGASASKGGNSTFGALTSAEGGGRGGDSNVNNAGAGGSGGGGGRNSAGGTLNGGVATSGQGSNGGSTTAISGYPAGGGGGKTAAGGNGTNNTSAAGGAGTSAYSSWGSAIGVGQNIAGTYWFAGGGGGAGDGGSTTAGAGGSGGGGAGGYSPATGTAGTVNTGGGGGGGVNAGQGAAGGSGIIIIRYPV
jgi:hypothetical protein